ncbi:MAG: hypothetical protein JF606_00260 [Burkholderiales bacterium]|nr:hypothetical protein [Burkholderiales bacterium]
MRWLTQPGWATARTARSGSSCMRCPSPDLSCCNFLTPRLTPPPRAAPRFLAATRRIAEARDRLAGANLRLVLSIAKRYLFSGILMDDLIQEGNIGLLFDPAPGRGR